MSIKAVRYATPALQVDRALFEQAIENSGFAEFLSIIEYRPTWAPDKTMVAVRALMITMLPRFLFELGRLAAADSSSTIEGVLQEIIGRAQQYSEGLRGAVLCFPTLKLSS